jgi:hypothetical protein
VKRGDWDAVRVGSSGAILPGDCVEEVGVLGFGLTRSTRLKSVKNIEKITKASHAVRRFIAELTDPQSMKVVASTKLTRAEKAMREAKKYGAANNGEPDFRISAAPRAVDLS